MGVSAPDFIEPVIGYRGWRVDQARLWAWAAGSVWGPGVNRARCYAGVLGKRRLQSHSVPDQNCSCGLYALNDSDDARLPSDADVWGAIAAWGDVQVYQTGFRAEFACVVALAASNAAEEWKRWRVEAVARAYGVPVVPVGELEAAARVHGAPLVWDALPPSRPCSPVSVSPPVRAAKSFAAVGEQLDALRSEPRFPDALAFDAEVLGVLEPRLMEDSALRGHLARADATLALHLRDLDADVWFDLRPPSASVDIGARSDEPDVFIELDADLAADYLLGRADLASAIRRKEASLRGERGHALVLLSMLSELVRPSQAHGHRRPLQPLTRL